ncbi:hypothetical protein ACLESO_07655 [Pyxidicoccus sp. 3LG]
MATASGQEEARGPRRTWRVVAMVLTLGTCLGCSGLLWVFSSGLQGTDKDEGDFSPAEQRRLLDKFSPVPVPASATDVRIRYQQFQDWSLRMSFTLPPGDFESYVAGLTSSAQQPGQYACRTRLGDGGFVADACTLTVDPAARRVSLHAMTW